MTPPRSVKTPMAPPPVSFRSHLPRPHPTPPNTPVCPALPNLCQPPPPPTFNFSETKSVAFDLLSALGSCNAPFVWFISHQPTVLFSQNKPAPAISHQLNEQTEGDRPLRPPFIDTKASSYQPLREIKKTKLCMLGTLLSFFISSLLVYRAQQLLFYL
jgi:hypothetical protein